VSPTAPSIHHIDAVLRHVPGARFLAIRSPVPAAWPARIERDGRSFRLRWCGSSLEVREVLAGEDDGEDGVIVLTSLSEAELGSDVLARFARGKLFAVESWLMLREAFQARQLDPRLRGNGWVADFLLEHRPPDGFAPVSGGVLDADTVWRTLLSIAIGLEDARPDLDLLLGWTLSDDGLYRLAQLSAEARDGIARHLRAVVGPAGSLVVDAIMAGTGADSVALGLVCDVVFSEGWSTTDLATAAVRLEPLIGRNRIDATAGRQWADAAIRQVRRPTPHARGLFQRAEEILRDIHAFVHVGRSAILPAAFDARLGTAAAAIERAFDQSGSPESLAAAEAAGRLALAHEQVAFQKARADRLRMALRLLRWLAIPSAPATSFEQAAAGYVSDGGFVDWARSALMGGDDLALVSSAFQRLASEVRQRRERENRAFAVQLESWTGQAGSTPGLTPIEAVLDRVIAPAAAAAPVLLLVLDGMGFSVFREISRQLADDGWNELAVDGCGMSAAISTLPTVTEVARTSLFCGRLCQGAAAAERTGFAQHAALLRACRNGPAPILFHKGDLNDAAALSNEVRLALADVRNRVIGIVYNAVDDHLSGADQARPQWSLEHMQLMRPILHEARNAGRLVVVTADHGHVLEDGTRQAGKGGGDRWRPGGEVADGEIAFGRGRVLTPDGAQTVVLPWSEGLRYGAKKAGYHGGATPQEVLVPLSVFWPGDSPPLWELAPPVTPDWWAPPLTAPVPEAVAIRPPSRRRSTKPVPVQPILFAELAQPPVVSAAVSAPGWLSALIASEVYAAQIKLAGKGAPREDDVRAILAAVAERGRLPRNVLAKRLGIAVIRLNGALAAVRRVINVDQTPIITVDETADVVELDIKQLGVQFEIEASNRC